MANEEHLARLKQGVEAWNKWREVHPQLRPDLTRATLTRADLSHAILIRAVLKEAILDSAGIGWTTFGDVDLSQARGLDTIRHYGSSTIGIDTLYRSHGNIPE